MNHTEWDMTLNYDVPPSLKDETITYWGDHISEGFLSGMIDIKPMNTFEYVGLVDDYREEHKKFPKHFDPKTFVTLDNLHLILNMQGFMDLTVAFVQKNVASISRELWLRIVKSNSLPNIMAVLDVQTILCDMFEPEKATALKNQESYDYWDKTRRKLLYIPIEKRVPRFKKLVRKIPKPKEPIFSTEELYQLVLRGKTYALRRMTKENFDRIKDFWFTAKEECVALLTLLPSDWWETIKEKVWLAAIRTKIETTITITKQFFMALTPEEQFYVLPRYKFGSSSSPMYPIYIEPCLSLEEFYGLVVGLKILGFKIDSDISRKLEYTKFIQDTQHYEGRYEQQKQKDALSVKGIHQWSDVFWRMLLNDITNFHRLTSLEKEMGDKYPCFIDLVRQHLKNKSFNPGDIIMGST